MNAPRRILVVEDQWLIADQTEQQLRAAGYDVVGPAATVAAALDLLDGEAVDAAVLDIHLNGETSFPIAQMLMERGVPFLFVSGFEAGDLPPAFRACAHLRKPFASDALVMHLEWGGALG
ncbi:MAG: response regulator [Caulobacteraceae bacterium]